MWKLWNRLFGFHYVQIWLCNTGYVVRVKRAVDGSMCINFAGSIHRLNEDGRISRSGCQWEPLTWVNRDD